MMSAETVQTGEGQPFEEAGDQEERKEIDRLVRRLPRSSVVRRFAEALLEGKPDEAGSVQPLLEVLANPSESAWRERTVAVWAVGRAPMTPQMKGRVAQALGSIVMNDQISPIERFIVRGIRAFAYLCVFGLGAELVNAILDFLCLALGFSSSSLYMDAVKIVLFGCCCTLPFLSFASDARRNNRARCLAIRSLGRLAQPLSVGVLAWAVMDYNEQIGKEAEQALLKVLPTLSPEQCGLHDRETVPRLCQLVSCDSYAPVPWLQILKALAQIGDGRAIQPLQWIVRQHAKDEIGRAATEVLPILRERQQRENDASRLVRAAVAPSAPSNLLLRPAQNSGTSEERLLLRSSAPDEDGQ